VLVPASKKRPTKPPPSPNPSPRPIDLSAPRQSVSHRDPKVFPELPDLDSDDSDDYTWQECYMPDRREGIPPQHIFSAGLRGAIDYNNSVRRHIHTCVDMHNCEDHTDRHSFLTWDPAKNDFVLNAAEGALFMDAVMKQRGRAHNAFAAGASLNEVIEMQNVEDLRPAFVLPESIT